MRLHHIVLITIFAAACDQPPGAGTEGHPCRSGWTTSLCNDGLRCADEGCVACGKPGEICCAEVLALESCDPGFACAGAADGYGECQGECGLIGTPCCAGNVCPGGGECNVDNGQCEGAESDACFSGPLPFKVSVIDSLCAEHDITFMVDSPEMAEECRQKRLVDLAKPGEEVCGLNVLPDLTDVCELSINGSSPMQLWNCSADQLALCEANWCVDGCSWTPGTCQ